MNLSEILATKRRSPSYCVNDFQPKMKLHLKKIIAAIASNLKSSSEYNIEYLEVRSVEDNSIRVGNAWITLLKSVSLLAFYTARGVRGICTHQLGPAGIITFIA